MPTSRCRAGENDEFGMSNWLHFGIRTSAFALCAGHRRDARETRHRLRHDARVEEGQVDGAKRKGQLLPFATLAGLPARLRAPALRSLREKCCRRAAGNHRPAACATLLGGFAGEAAAVRELSIPGVARPPPCGNCPFLRWRDCQRPGIVHS